MRDQRNWTWHVISGVVILVFAGLHMAIMHLDSLLGIFNPAGGHPIEWANVVARMRSGFFTVTYVVLLGAARVDLGGRRIIKKGHQLAAHNRRSRSLCRGHLGGVGQLHAGLDGSDLRGRR
jgi:hypothetical protein